MPTMMEMKKAAATDRATMSKMIVGGNKRIFQK
jgi:hypothetical protein